MKILEIHADDAGETHFRHTDVPLALRDFAPPSPAIRVSADLPATAAVFLVAPPGWDDNYHPSPRKQYAVLLSGRLSVRATDGRVETMEPGMIVLLNDQGSKGHLSTVIGDEPATFLLVAVAD